VQCGHWGDRGREASRTTVDTLLPLDTQTQRGIGRDWKIHELVFWMSRSAAIPRAEVHLEGTGEKDSSAVGKILVTWRLKSYASYGTTILVFVRINNLRSWASVTSSFLGYLHECLATLDSKSLHISRRFPPGSTTYPLSTFNFPVEIHPHSPRLSFHVLPSLPRLRRLTLNCRCGPSSRNPLACLTCDADGMVHLLKIRDALE
jgi:hypothetical protein